MITAEYVTQMYVYLLCLPVYCINEYMLQRASAGNFWMDMLLKLTT